MRFFGDVDWDWDSDWDWGFFLAAARALDMRASKAEGREDMVGLRLDWGLGLVLGLGLDEKKELREKDLNDTERGGEKRRLRLRERGLWPRQWHERRPNINC